MTYQSQLPDIFPHGFQMPEDTVTKLISILIASRDGVLNGSSFAVTSDAPRGFRHIWLSDVSYRTFIESNLIPSISDYVRARRETEQW